RDAGTRRVVHGIGDVEAAEAQLVALHVRAQALREAEPRRADLTALGGDDHYTVGGLGTVDRRGRGPLEDFDGGDVVRVEVGDAVDAVVLLRPTALRDRIEAARGDRVRNREP